MNTKRKTECEMLTPAGIKRRVGVSHFLMCFFLLMVGACGGKSEEQARLEAQQADSAALKIAVLPTLDCLPLFVAQQLGMDEAFGLDLRLVPFTAQMDQDTALLRGRVEGMFTDIVRARRMESIAHKPLYVSCETSLYWQLLSAKTARIKQMKQLDDKMVAMTRHSATDSLTQLMIDSAKLQSTRVYRIQVNDVSVRYDMLTSGNIDAAWLPQPWAAMARKKGAVTLIPEAGRHSGVLVFADSVMADTMRRRQVLLLERVYKQAVDTINGRGLDSFSELLATYCHVDPKHVSNLSGTAPIDQVRRPVATQERNQNTKQDRRR